MEIQPIFPVQKFKMCMMHLHKKKINKSKQKKFLRHYQEVNIPYMCPFTIMMVSTNCHHYRTWNCLGDKSPETSLRDDFASRPACKGFINEVNWDGKKKSIQKVCSTISWAWVMGYIRRTKWTDHKRLAFSAFQLWMQWDQLPQVPVTSASLPQN